MKESFERELEELQKNTVLSPDYRRKGLIKYGIRTSIAIVLYILFWKYDWVRWSLYFYVPLNLLGLFIILGSGAVLQRKIDRVREKIDLLEEE